jgi:hypothetical protein
MQDISHGKSDVRLLKSYEWWTTVSPISKPGVKLGLHSWDLLTMFTKSLLNTYFEQTICANPFVCNFPLSSHWGWNFIKQTRRPIRRVEHTTWSSTHTKRVDLCRSMRYANYRDDSTPQSGIVLHKISSKGRVYDIFSVQSALGAACPIWCPPKATSWRHVFEISSNRDKICSKSFLNLPQSHIIGDCSRKSTGSQFRVIDEDFLLARLRYCTCIYWIIHAMIILLGLLPCAGLE